MNVTRLRTRLGLGAAAVLGIMAPISFSPAQGVSAPTATCATCCPQSGATCVLCGTKSCSTFTDAYDAKVGGPCSSQM